MNDRKPFDREAVGWRIGMVRRKARLSQIDFAKKLKIPVMITEIAEHGIKSDDDAAVSFDLSINALLHLMTQISDKFDVPYDWLMHGNNAPYRADEVPSSLNNEVTLFLPMTISDSSLASEMYDALIMMSTSRQYESERYNLQKAMLESIVEKYRLYRQHTDSSGDKEHANLACRQMLEVINRHQSHYIM